MSLLNQLEQQHHNAARQQTDRARNEAEALFRPKLKLVERSPLATPRADPAARKPRILSALGPPLQAETAKAPISTEPRADVSVSQFTCIERERLKRARAALFKQQLELQAKRDAIDGELRGIDAYEAAKKSDRSPG